MKLWACGVLATALLAPTVVHAFSQCSPVTPCGHESITALSAFGLTLYVPYGELKELSLVGNRSRLGGAAARPNNPPGPEQRCVG